MPRHETLRLVKGKCSGCGHEDFIEEILHHVKTCQGLAQRMVAAGGIHHVLTITIKVLPFWLVIQARDDATVKQLHDAVDEVWLDGDMCGHMAEMDFGRGRKYVVNHPMEPAQQESRLGDILRVGDKGMYQYDLGTSTWMNIHVESIDRAAVVPMAAVRVVGRNNFPTKIFTCKPCGAQARYDDYENCERLCPSCLTNKVGELPADVSWPILGTVEDNDGESLYIYRIWNSPRVGACGYDGPSDPQERLALGHQD